MAAILRARLAWALFASLCCPLAAAAPQAALTMLSSYESPPGVFHVLLCNGTPDQKEIRVTAVMDSDGHQSASIWWTRIEPKIAAPGRWVHLYFKTKQERQESLPLRVSLDVSGKEQAIEAASAKPDVEFSYAVQVAATKRAYLYLRNNTDKEIPVDSVRLNRAFVTGMGPTVPTPIPAKGMGLVFGSVGLEIPTAGALPVHAAVAMAGTLSHVFGYLFADEQFAAGAEDNSYLMGCLTHEHGAFDEAAEALFARADTQPASPRTIHLCRSSLEQGLCVFGTCVERVIANPQASNRKRGSSDWLNGLLEMAHICRGRVEPGLLCALVENVSALSSDARQGSMSRRELRSTVYAELTGGAKGVRFRTNDSPAYSTAVAVITQELNEISSYLAISEPAELVTACSSPEVIAKTLLCGDRGILLIVLRKDLGDLGLLRSLHVVLSPPNWMKLSRFTEIGGERASGELRQANEQIELAIEALDSTGVYLLPALVPECPDTRPKTKPDRGDIE